MAWPDQDGGALLAQLQAQHNGMMTMLGDLQQAITACEGHDDVAGYGQLSRPQHLQKLAEGLQHAQTASNQLQLCINDVDHGGGN